MAGRLGEIRVVDPVLTNFVRGYSNAEFVGKRLFPVVIVPKETGKYIKHGKESFRIYSTERALRADSNKLPPDARTTAAFQTTEHDASWPLDYREEKEDIINAEKHGSYSAQSAIEIRHEKIAAGLALDANNYPSGHKVTLGADEYFDDADSDPVAIIDAGKEAVRAAIVKRPNTAVFSAKAWRAFKNHAKVRAYLSDNKTKIITIEDAKKILELDEIHIAEAVYMKDDGTVEDIWGDDVVLAYVNKGVKTGKTLNGTDKITYSMYDSSYGYTFRVKGLPFVDKYNENGGKISLVRSTDNFEVKIVGSDAGYLISGVLTP